MNDWHISHLLLYSKTAPLCGTAIFVYTIRFCLFFWLNPFSKQYNGGHRLSHQTTTDLPHIAPSPLIPWCDCFPNKESLSKNVAKYCADIDIWVCDIVHPLPTSEYTWDGVITRVPHIASCVSHQYTPNLSRVTTHIPIIYIYRKRNH